MKDDVSSWLRSNWFVLGVLAAVGIGLWQPAVVAALTAHGGITRGITAALFLIVGLTLPTERIGDGLRQTKLHLLVQTTVFVISPLYFTVTAGWLAPVLGEGFIIGVYALAVLPTTVSSCIVFTQSAGGNTVGTIFNSVVANVVGVFLAPLLLSLLLQTGGAALPRDEITRIATGVALTMLLPVILGQLARGLIRPLIVRNKRRLGVVSNLLILCIVASSVAAGTANARFPIGGSATALRFVYVAASHVLLVTVVYALARAIGLDRENRISAMFAAPQKTLVAGAPLLTTYFATTPELLGAALLPLLMYHVCQLIVASFIRATFLRGKPQPGSPVQ